MEKRFKLQLSHSAEELQRQRDVHLIEIEKIRKSYEAELSKLNHKHTQDCESVKSQANNNL